MSFDSLAARLNSSVLSTFGETEPVQYRDAAGGFAVIQAIYVHSDENGATERFEAREVDFPALPKQGDTITRANGSVFRLTPPKRVDGGWLHLDVTLLQP